MRPEVIKQTKVFSTSISDHEMVACIRKRNHMRFPAKTTRVRENYNPENVKKEPLHKTDRVYLMLLE